MTAQTADILKGYFRAGNRPTQSNYEDLIDSIGFANGSWLSALAYGCAGDATGTTGIGTDDTSALQNFFDECATAKAIAVLPPRLYRITAGVTVGEDVRGIIAPGATLFVDTSDQTTGGMALSTPRFSTRLRGIEQSRFYVLPNIYRANISDWSDETCVGLKITGVRQSNFHVGLISGFTVNLQLLGGTDQNSESNFWLTMLWDGKVGLDLRGSTYAPNAHHFWGGQFSVQSTTNPAQTAYGVRFSRETGGYNSHNANTFYGPEFQMGHSSRTGGAEGIPIRFEVNGSQNGFYSVRGENTASTFIESTAAAFENVCEILFSNNGYGDVIRHTSTATKNWGLLENARYSTLANRARRTVAAHENVRVAAYYYDAENALLGIDQMCAVDATPTGTPTTLAQFAFEGTTIPVLGADYVELTTAGGIGWVVDTTRTKSFFLDWGNHSTTGANGRQFIQCFDSSDNLLTNSGGALVLGGQGTLQYNSTAQFWTMSADQSDSDFTRCNAIRVASSVAKVIIGVYQPSASAVRLTSIRLTTDAPHAPPILWGTAGYPWGKRRYPFSDAFTPTAVSADSESTKDITVSGALPGDAVFGEHSRSIGNNRLFKRVLGSNTVRFSLAGNSAGTSTVSAGTLRGWIEKQPA